MNYSLCGDFLNPKKVIYSFLKYGYEYITREKKDFFPWAVEVHPTAKCNHRCIHCSYKERNENRAEMRLEIFSRLIDSLLRMKVKGVYFSGGGEPCVYPGLPDAIRKLNQGGVEVALVTNGSLLDAETSRLFDALQYLNYIAVSVPSCTAETFKKITGQDYVDRILNLPGTVKSKHGSKAPIIGARVVVTNLIAEEVPFILQTLREKAFDYALFKIVRDYESRGLGVSEAMEKKLHEEVQRLAENGEVDQQFTNLDRIFSYRKPYDAIGTCHINKMGLLAAVTPEGDVYPNISEIGHPEFLIGNLSQGDLDVLWNSPEHLRVKEASATQWRGGQCRDCRAIAYNNQINGILNEIPVQEDPFV